MIRRKRILIAALGTLAAVALDMGAYYACVSVRFEHSLAVKEPSIESPYAYYRVGQGCQGLARFCFEPARLLDALYFRPGLWKDSSRDSRSV